MEHRLIQGGEQYLPFARSCVAKLKKLGLPYANQSFEIDGVSVKVRIEPGHEYIRIEGGGVLGWRVNPNDDDSPYGYVARPDGTPEQVPYLADDLEEPDEGENTNKTRNPYVFVKPSGAIREETTLVHGDYFWSDGKNERLLFGVDGGGFVSYQQRRVTFTGLSGPQMQSGAIAKGKDANGKTKKYVVLAVDAGGHTDFFSVPLSEVRGARDLCVLGGAVKIGSGPETIHELSWRFSPDGLSAIALEGRLAWSSDLSKETEFLRFTDTHRNSWEGVQHIHRAALSPAVQDGGFTVVFSKETREGALLKCVPTTSFNVVSMSRHLEIHPAFISEVSYGIRYAIKDAIGGDEFNKSAVAGIAVSDYADPRLAEPYPEMLRATPVLNDDGSHADAEGWTPGALGSPESEAKKYYVHNTSVVPEVMYGSGVAGFDTITYMNDDGSYGTRRRYFSGLSRSEKIYIAGTQESDPFDSAESVSFIKNVQGERNVDGVRSVISNIVKRSQYGVVSFGQVTDQAVQAGQSWSLVGFTTVRIASNLLYGSSVGADDSVHRITRNPIMSAYQTSMVTYVQYPFDHSVATHWTRNTTFNYEGRRVVGVDYKNDGTETFLEIAGRPDEKITINSVEKSSSDYDNGTLLHGFTANGACGYSLLIDDEVIATHTVTAKATKDTSVIDGLEDGSKVVRSDVTQHVSEDAFFLAGYDLRNGVVLTAITSNAYVESSDADTGLGTSGEIVSNGSLMIRTVGGGIRPLLEFTETRRHSSVRHGLGLDERDVLIRAITGHGIALRNISASNPSPVSGVHFTRQDFGEEGSTAGLPVEAGRVKFQELLPVENRDVGGILGEYRGKYSQGWYRSDQAIQAGGRGWLFREVVVATPGSNTSFLGDLSAEDRETEPTEFKHSLFAIGEEKWMVLRHADYVREGESDPDIMFIGSGEGIKRVLPNYLSATKARFTEAEFIT